MFNIGPQELAVILLVAVIVFGPDRLPALARQAAQMLKTLRDLSDNARKQLSEISPGLGEQLTDLNSLRKKGLGGASASSALQKMIFEDDDDPLGFKAVQREDQAGSAPAPTIDPQIVAANAAPIADASPAAKAAGAPVSVTKEAVAEAPTPPQPDAPANPPTPLDDVI